MPDSAGSGSSQHGTDVDHLTVDDVMHGIMMQESGGNYKAENPYETASGAYQYIDGTWAGYGGYSHASDAPKDVQDAKARSDLEAAYKRLGDWERVIASHFAGEDGQEGPKSNWNQVPHPENHNPSIREYVDGVLKHIQEYDGAQHKSMLTEQSAASADTDADGDDVHDATGTHDGHEATGAHELAGGGSAGNFAIDQGAELGSVDTDGDGLTDEFERMVGTDPVQADTDHDGLTDGYESALGTDPLQADSDHDGLTDQLEVHFGSDPLASSLGTGSVVPGATEDDDPGHHADPMHSGVDVGWH